MAHRVVLISALLLVGCGGNDFHTLFGPDADASGDSLGGGTGGAGAGGMRAIERPNTGGAPEADAGEDTGHGTGGTAAGGAAPLETGGAGGSSIISSGGTAGCALKTHVNGVGQTWQDCAELGTYNEHEASLACVAFTGDARKCSFAPGCGTAKYVMQGFGVSGDFLWGYDGNTAGYVGVNGECPTAATGKQWL